MPEGEKSIGENGPELVQAAQFAVSRQFVLVEGETGTVIADGVYTFGVYILSWRGEPQKYTTYPTLAAAIEAHGSDPNLYYLRWGTR